MADDLLSRALRRVSPEAEISRISRKPEFPGNDKPLDDQRFPGFPGFPGSELDADNSADFDDGGSGGRVRAGERAGARDHDVPGKPGNPGNASTISGVPSSFFSRKERETGKSGKSVSLTDLVGLAVHPDDVLDFYEERAAIREYDGEMPRHEAEAAALQDVEMALTDGRIQSIPLDRRPRF